MEVDLNFFKAMFSFSGHINRPLYWKYMIIAIWIPLLFLWGVAVLSGFYQPSIRGIVIVIPENPSSFDFLTVILGIYCIFALTWGAFALMVKRLRDFSVSPWFSLLYILFPGITMPIYGLFPTNIDIYKY